MKKGNHPDSHSAADPAGQGAPERCKEEYMTLKQKQALHVYLGYDTGGVGTPFALRW